MKVNRTVRRLALLGVAGLTWFGLSAVPAWADNGPHSATAGNTTTDRCAGCHQAHTAQAANLLPADQPAMCYTCHGTGGAGATTSVQEGVAYGDTGHTGGSVGALRGGGFEFALIGSGAATIGSVPVGASTAITSTHSVDGTAQIAWGGGAVGSGAGPQIALRCGSCHDPHGNGNYRILRTIPTGSGGTGSAITDTGTTAHTYTTTDYWLQADTNQPAFVANVAAWCTQCHTRYLSGSGATDSGDAMYGFRHMSNGTAAAGGTTIMPNCITCHTAHGSNAAMTGYAGTVTNPDGSANGGSRLLRVDNRGVCQMCHNR